MRLKHIAGAPPNPSHFTVLVCSIPQCSQETHSETVNKFFTKYHSSSYLSHQIVYRSGRVQKLMVNEQLIIYSQPLTDALLLICWICMSVNWFSPGLLNLILFPMLTSVYHMLESQTLILFKVDEHMCVFFL